MTEKFNELRHAKPSFSSLAELKKVTGDHSPLWVITKFGEGINLLLNKAQMGAALLVESFFEEATMQNQPQIKTEQSSVRKIAAKEKPKAEEKLEPLYKEDMQNKAEVNEKTMINQTNYLKGIQFPKIHLNIFKRNDKVSKKHSLVPASFWNKNQPKSRVKSFSRALTAKEVIRPSELSLGVQNITGAPLVTLDASTLSLLNNFKRGMRLLQFGILVVFLVIGIQTYVLLTNQAINFQASATSQTVATVSSLPVNSEPGLRIITNFTTNQGVVDIGYSLDVQKEIIKMKNTSNCKTPGVPPLQNGCNITILPGALGIPARGTIFKNIQFEGTIPKDSKIKMDLKDFETGEVTQDLGSFGSDKVGKNIPIPANISNTQGLYLRFWTIGGEISIKKIAIEYYNVEQVKPVSGKINPDLLKDIKNFTVWEDKDQNRLWDPKNDVQWGCRPNFPGVLPLEFGTGGSFVMTRDDSCFTDIKPDKWYVDKGINVLPPGLWLLVSQDPQVAISFEVKASGDKVIMEIDSFDKVNYK